MTKKISIFNLFAVLLFLTGTFTSKAQALEEGNISINTYYGSPSIGTMLMKSIFTSDSDIDQDLDFINIGPVGVQAEYMVTENIGIGIEGSYSNILIKYTEIYDYNFSLTRIRVMPRFSYHFSSSDWFDTYLSLGMGYKHSILKFTTNDPLETDEQEDFEETAMGGIPLALRIGWGARFYITENLGISTELGFGGGYLLSGGLVYKL